MNAVKSESEPIGRFVSKHLAMIVSVVIMLISIGGTAAVMQYQVNAHDKHFDTVASQLKDHEQKVVAVENEARSRLELATRQVEDHRNRLTEVASEVSHLRRDMERALQVLDRLDRKMGNGGG